MKLSIITNLFPLPWEPNRAAFNRQQFSHLARYCELKLTVVVAWVDAWRNRRAARPTEVSGIPVRYLWYFYTPKFARVTYGLTLFLSLLARFRYFAVTKPDCLMVSWAYPDGVAGVLLGRLLGLPVVIKVHGSDVNVGLENPWQARQILWSMNRAKAIISVSRALKERLESIGVPAEKIHVVYNGIDHSIFHPDDKVPASTALQLPPGRRIMLYVGNLKLEKGCVDLLEAFAMIADTIEDVDLCYIGTGVESDTIRQKAAETGLSDRVRLLGSMGHGELAHWFRLSKLVVLPSHNEGVPNVLLEAMACGTPLVATRVGGIPEIVPDHAGILVEPHDAAGLAKALVDAVNRRWDSEKITLGTKDYCWDNNARQLYGLLEGVVAQGRQQVARK